VSAEDILAVARRDAESAYGDLSPYRVTVALEPDGWHVHYDLKDCAPTAAGRTTS
jgi:hypothetical protein